MVTPISRCSLAFVAVFAAGCHFTMSGVSGEPDGGGGASDGGGVGGNSDGGAAPDLAGPGGTPDGGGGGDLAVPGDVIDKLLQLTAKCTTAEMVSKHTYTGGMVNDVPICALKGALFFNADMDIDCDGRPTGNKCPGPDPSYQDDTAFHNLQDKPLAAAETPYVVIPYDFSYAGLDSNNGGNVVAVIFDHKLQFAVFGDTGPTNIIGEASYACAEKLGIDPNPATGGTPTGVTYIVFVGAGTAPHDIESQSETKQLGDTLVTKLLADN